MLHSHEGNLVATVHCQREILQQLDSLGGIVQLFHPQHVVADFPIRLEVHVGELAAGDRKLLQGQLVVDLLAAGSLAALGGVGGEPKDELLQVLHLFFTLLGLILGLFLHNLTHLIPEVVVSAEQADFAIINITNAGTN